MAYPRNIYLDAETENRLRAYIDDELLRHYADRGDYIDRIKQSQRDYWAEPKSKRAKFPFDGASRLIIPLIAISFEAVHARTMTTLRGLEQFVSVKAKSDELSDVAVPLENLLTNEIVGDPDNYKSIDSSVIECEKYGNGCLKSSYELLTKTAIRDITDPNTGEILRSEPFTVVVKNGGIIDSVPIGRFIMPFSSQDPQKAPWCGEEHDGSPYEVKRLVESGFFYPEVMDNLESWISYSRAGSSTLAVKETKNQQEDLEKTQASWPRVIDWFEIWLAFNVDGNEDGEEREIVVHYHRESGKFMSVRYNWHDDLHRPYRNGVYFPVEHRWPGIGICKQVDQFQREVTTIHRQMLDAGTIANAPMLKIHKLSGYGAGEPVFPGKQWHLDDMTMIEPFKLSDVAPSSYSNENLSVIYAQQRSGVNEVILGMPQVGTPGTATSDLARIQEGNKKFDYSYKNIKDWLNTVVIDMTCLIHQFGARTASVSRYIDPENLLSQFFQLPIEVVRSNAVLEVTLAGQQQNKILDRQNWQQVALFTQQYYKGMLELAQLTGNQQLMALIANKGLLAGTEAFRQLLETFDIRNIDRITLEQTLKAAMQNGQQPINQPGAIAGRSNQPQIPSSTTGMGDINQIVQSLRAPNGSAAS